MSLSAMTVKAAASSASRCQAAAGPQPRLRPALPSFRREPRRSAAQEWVDTVAHSRFYQPVVCGSKAHKHKAPKASKSKRGRVNSMVAEVESLVGRLELETGEPLPTFYGLPWATAPEASAAPLATPAPEVPPTASPSSSSSSSTSPSSSDSESSDSSDSEEEECSGASAFVWDAAAFERQREELLQRLATSGAATSTFATASAAAAATASPPSAPGASSNVLPLGTAPGPYPSAATTGRVMVCMGKACAKRGASQLLAGFQSAAGAPTAAGVAVEIAPCKCMGKCKAGPHVKVEAAGQGARLHSNVAPSQVRAIWHDAFGAQADLFDFV